MENSRDDQKDEVSILDLFVALAESWPLIVGGAIVAALIGYFVASAQPVHYRATAVLEMSSAESKELLSVSTTAATSARIENAIAPDEWAQRLVITPLSSTSVQISLVSPDAEQVTGQLSALLAVHSENLLSEDKAGLELELERATSRHAELETTIERLDRAISLVEAQTPFDGAAFAELASLQRQVSGEHANMGRRMEYISEALAKRSEQTDVPVVSRAQAEGRRSPTLVATIAAVGAAFGLFILVLARSSWIAAGQSRDGAAKLQRIRRAILLRPRQSAGDLDA